MSKASGPQRRASLGEGYHSPQVEAEVRLNTNEAPEPPPAEFVAELQAAIGELAFNRYPDRRATRLRQAIAVHHGVDEEAVFCANGSNEVIQSLLLAYGGPGRSASVFEPTYALHSHISRITSTEVVEGRRGDDYLIDPAEVDRTLVLGKDGGPAVVFLCSPNNPTGRAEPEGTVQQVIERAPGLVILDEAYGAFAGRSAVGQVATSPNLAVVRTFSKTWSLAALRLGYVIAAPEVVAACFEAALPYHLDAVKQVAGELALHHVGAMEERRQRLVAERQRLTAALIDLGLAPVPSDANFILFELPGRDASEVWQQLLAQSVLVRNVSSWPGLERFLRVTIGTPEENDAFLKALTAAVG